MIPKSWAWRCPITSPGFPPATAFSARCWRGEKSGAGCRVETSLFQATLSFIGETAAGYLRTGNVPSRMARVKNAHAFAFVCKDDRPLAIHCSVPEKFWLALLKAADRMDIAADERFKQTGRAPAKLRSARTNAGANF